MADACSIPWIRTETVGAHPQDPLQLFLPLISFGISLIYSLVGPLFGLESRFSFGIGIAALIASLRLAKTDRDELASRGLCNPPNIAWVLLGSITYLGIRFYRISHVGGKASGPFWVALGTTIAQVAIVVVAVLAVSATVLTQSAPPAASDISSILEQEMLAAGYSVTCPERGDFSDGATFTCPVTDPNGAITAVDVKADLSDNEFFYLITAAR